MLKETTALWTFWKLVLIKTLKLIREKRELKLKHIIHITMVIWIGATYLLFRSFVTTLQCFIIILQIFYVPCLYSCESRDTHTYMQSYILTWHCTLLLLLFIVAAGQWRNRDFLSIVVNTRERKSGNFSRWKDDDAICLLLCK